jgi:hypothetical protein
VLGLYQMLVENHITMQNVVEQQFLKTTQINLLAVT